MIRLFALAIFLLSFGVSALARPQQTLPKIDLPVTQKEFDFVMRKFEDAICSTLRLPLMKRGIPASATSSATRAMVIERMDAIFEYSKGKFTNTPRPFEYDPKMFLIPTSVQPKLVKLVRYGCIGPVSVLATGPTDSISPEDFGDAVGLFLVRIADLTHTSSARFSPDLIFDRMPEKTSSKSKSGG